MRWEIRFRSFPALSRHDGEPGLLPERFTLIPLVLDRRTRARCRLDQIRADNKPDLALVLQSGRQVIGGREGGIFEVEERHPDAGQVAEGNMNERRTIHRLDAVRRVFIGTWTTRNNHDLVEPLTQSFGDTPMVDSWRIERPTEDGNSLALSRCHTRKRIVGKTSKRRPFNHSGIQPNPRETIRLSERL